MECVDDATISNKLILYDNIERMKKYNKQINKLNEDAFMLYDIHMDMYELIHIQDEDIAKIKKNIESSNISTHKAENELNLSEKYYNNITSKKLLLVGLLTLSISAPIGIFISTKAMLGTLSGFGLSSIIYKIF
jgi:t-SNARE complex subunit (syntaxin)